MNLFDRLEKLFMAVAFAESGDRDTAEFWVNHREKTKYQQRWQTAEKKRKRPQFRI